MKRVYEKSSKIEKEYLSALEYIKGTVRSFIYHNYVISSVYGIDKINFRSCKKIYILSSFISYSQKIFSPKIKIAYSGSSSLTLKKRSKLF